MPSTSKLQRWTDLLASLLRRHYAATFEQLAKDVPADSTESQADSARMRMFERDKDELRALGIAIETVPFDEGESTGYRSSAATEAKGRVIRPYGMVAASGMWYVVAYSTRSGECGTFCSTVPRRRCSSRSRCGRKS